MTTSEVRSWERSAAGFDETAGGKDTAGLWLVFFRSLSSAGGWSRQR